MGGQKTSVYLSDSLAAQWRASGLTLSELIRRGLERGSVEDTLRRVLREELGQGRPAVIAASPPEPQHGRTPELTPELEHEPSPEPARTRMPAARSCTHKRVTSSKGGKCHDCGDWVPASS